MLLRDPNCDKIRPPGGIRRGLGSLSFAVKGPVAEMLTGLCLSRAAQRLGKLGGGDTSGGGRFSFHGTLIPTVCRHLTCGNPCVWQPLRMATPDYVARCGANAAGVSSIKRRSNMDTIQKLRARRADLARQLQRIDAMLSEHERLESLARELLGEGATQSVSPAASTTTSSPTKQKDDRRHVRPEVAAFEATVLDILTRSETPLDRSDLLESLVSLGVSVGGQDPKNTLGARMSRMKGVLNVKGKGYWLEERLSELDDDDTLASERTFVSTVSPPEP